MDAISPCESRSQTTKSAPPPPDLSSEVARTCQDEEQLNDRSTRPPRQLPTAGTRRQGILQQTGSGEQQGRPGKVDPILYVFLRVHIVVQPSLGNF